MYKEWSFGLALYLLQICILSLKHHSLFVQSISIDFFYVSVGFSIHYLLQIWKMCIKNTNGKAQKLKNVSRLNEVVKFEYYITEMHNSGGFAIK